MVTHEIPIYEPHEGTIRIAGDTVPKRAGKCAYHFLERKFAQIDFFCIGANANQQATKAMGVFLYMTRNYAKLEIAFQPMRFMVITTNKTTGVQERKDCMVWRTIILQ